MDGATLLVVQEVRGKIPELRIDHVYDHEVHNHDAEQKAKTKDCRHTTQGQSLQCRHR